MFKKGSSSLITIFIELGFGASGADDAMDIARI